MTSEIEYRYALHDEVATYVAAGWVNSGPMMGHHGTYCCLVYREIPSHEKTPEEIKPHSAEPEEPPSAAAGQAERENLQAGEEMDAGRLAKDLMRDEGMRLKVYRCPAGKLTIGIGRNLEDVGISSGEAIDLLDNDIARVVSELNAALPWWRDVPEPGQRALANMAFNLGLTRLMEFQRMIAALRAGDYEAAAAEALDSKWAEQVGARAERIALLFRECGK